MAEIEAKKHGFQMRQDFYIWFIGSAIRLILISLPICFTASTIMGLL